ncbi:uncharacterized protein LOC124118971 isoform X6 [Haliotis rufescens]|uniref:uncharacterized protein LOC124118971 isoform X6 n=1 Tax=Haliotis rufescens TaxID=6454 RepID=UPI00201F7BA9|nr:uncharacterized protein LOC124118971 isoform X6 [Haliotis rufescens]
MANSYHMEALRKQRLLDRKNEALRRLEKQGTDLTKDAVMDGYLSKQTPKESPLITDEGQFNQQRNQGRNGHNCHKHINYSNVASDTIYPILHPKPVFKVPVPELPCRKPHFKV